VIMRHGISGRTGALGALVIGAALLLSSAALAGTPTLGAGCGSGASIVGSDTAGKLTLGTGSNICVLTFSTAFANAPACMAMNETNGGGHAAPAGLRTSTTQLMVDVPWPDGDVIAYICGSY
jgi:hypothetical protein